MNTEIEDQLFAGATLRRRIAEECIPSITKAARVIVTSFQNGGKVLLFGNGGSAADAQHIAAELVGWFRSKPRKALPAIALTTDSSVLTAVGNDMQFDQIFVRQIQALGNRGDVAIGLSTSGKSPNVVLALKEAAKQGMFTIGFTGYGNSYVAENSGIAIEIPSIDTALIQECHMAVGHIICGMVEKQLAREATTSMVRQ